VVKKHKKEHMDEHGQVANMQPSEEGDAADISADSDMNAKLAEKEKEAAANYDKYVRAVAELDNYKKRAAKEKADVLKFGKEEVIKDMLPFMDSLDRALEHAEKNADIKAFKEGLNLIQEQFLCCLKKHGVESIECAGKEFDPNFHEAMMQVDSEHHAENQVINDFQRGYLLNGRLLRPSKVSVCKKKNSDKNGCEQIAENGE
jgi:molecular chaperone GrpE